MPSTRGKKAKSTEIRKGKANKASKAAPCERVISRFANNSPLKQPSDNSPPKPDRPLPAFGTFLDPKISTFFVKNFLASPGPSYAVCRFDIGIACVPVHSPVDWYINGHQRLHGSHMSQIVGNSLYQ